MTTWRDVQAAAPEFARRVQSLFDAHKHKKTIATLRADGSPRISGIETAFTDGELTFGSMPNARKVLTYTAIPPDSRCTPRRSIRSKATKQSGPARRRSRGGPSTPARSPDGPDGDLFRADITEVVLTHLDDSATLLVIEWWTPTNGLRAVERE